MEKRVCGYVIEFKTVGSVLRKKKVDWREYSMVER